MGQSPLAVEGWPMVWAPACAASSVGNSAIAATDDKRRMKIFLFGIYSPW